jgi:ABC-type cobalamin/Fe3+-siderophores transport system ATPase subunit
MWRRRGRLYIFLMDITKIEFIIRKGTIAAHGPAAEVFAGPALAEVYGMDVSGFMRESLGKWAHTGKGTSAAI